ncbi:MAG: NAD(P)/FAD-dependent oxidoreductase [Candidatus Paceibacterota bacterium]
MKVAIIGGGICGLYLAKNLARKNNAVTVFERKKTIGKECCSGLFSSRIIDFIPESGRLATNRINSAIINFPKKSIKLKFRQAFFVIEHAQLDRLMAKLAIESGVKIITGETITQNELEQIANEYDRIIGCDGALSPTREYLGLKNPDFMLGIQGFEEKTDKSGFVETWATKNGFLWRIPRGQDIEWGIMEKPKTAPKLFNEFIVAKKLNLVRIKSAIIPQGLIIPKNERITLCGDASGLTKPWSGGGVIWNLTQTGFLLKNFPDFLQYKKEVERFFGLRIGLGKFAKTGVYAAGFSFSWLIPGSFNIDGDYLIKKN